LKSTKLIPAGFRAFVISPIPVYVTPNDIITKLLTK
jgi:hypothetical protein